MSTLKQQQAEIKQKKYALEKDLQEAKKQRDTAAKKLKNAQYDKQLQAANKKVEDLSKQKEIEKQKLNKDPDYKEAQRELRQVKSKIKNLEKKANDGTPLSKTEQTELKNLKKKQATLNSKISKLSKTYTETSAKLNAAKSEAKTLESMSKGNSARAKSAALSKIKKGKQKVRINLKKLPKSTLQKLQAGLNKTKAVASTGGKMLRGAGKVAKPVMAILAAVDIYNAYKTGGAKKAVRQTAKLGTSCVGAWAGAKGGAALGATIGSFVGPIGTVVGGFVGGLVGGIAGWWAGEKVYDAAEKVVLPTDTPLGQEQAKEGIVEFEATDEELEELLMENPELEDALEWVE